MYQYHTLFIRLSRKFKVMYTMLKEICCFNIYHDIVVIIVRYSRTAQFVYFYCPLES